MTRLNLTVNQPTSTTTTNRMAAVAGNPLHEAHTLGVFSSLFRECSLTEDMFRTLGELGW